MLPINKWDNEYQRVVLGYYLRQSRLLRSEEHINEVFLPKINNGDPLYVGFFHTGAYQDQISGYGGSTASSLLKHIIVGQDKNGKLVDWVYAKNKQRTAC
jgi:arginine decarboxylase